MTSSCRESSLYKSLPVCNSTVFIEFQDSQPIQKWFIAGKFEVIFPLHEIDLLWVDRIGLRSMLERSGLKLEYDAVKCRERVQFGKYRFIKPSGNFIIPDFAVSFLLFKLLFPF